MSAGMGASDGDGDLELVTAAEQAERTETLEPATVYQTRGREP